MNKILVAVAATFAFAGAAFAGEVEGTVKSVDPTSRTITLDDGTSFVVAQNVTIDALATGAKVKVTFDDGTANATAVEAVL